MTRKNSSRVMYSFYISRNGRDAIHKLAQQRGQTKADTIRAMLAYALLNMPTSYRIATDSD